MEPKTIRVGIIGAGGIARGYHAPSYSRCGNVEIVAAADVSNEALTAMQEVYGVKNLYADYADLLARDDIDLVSICTSNDMHYPVVMDAIAAGVDIYCEKPLALEYAQTVEMVQAAQAKSLKTGVNFSHRRTPASRLAKEIIDSGALGQIHYVSAIYAAGRAGYAEGMGTWRNMKEKAGFGGLGDMGSHMIDMMLWWLGCGVDAVAGQMKTFVPQRISRYTGEPMAVTTEDQGTLLFQYGNGAMGYLCGSYMFTGRGYDQRAEVYGTEGGLMYDQQRPHELQLYVDAEFLKQYTVLRQGGTSDTPYTTIAVPERHEGLIPGNVTARRTVLMDFIDAYRQPGAFTWSPGFREGMIVQEVLEAGAKANDSKAWVSLPL